MADDLFNFVGFIAMCSSTVFLWVWFAYPYDQSDRDFTVGFHLSFVSLIDSPNGSIARFSLRNDSRWEIAQTEVSVKIHALSRDQTRMGVVAGPKTSIVKNLGTYTEQFFDVPVEVINGGHLFGWTANIKSIKLPPVIGTSSSNPHSRHV